MHSLSRVGECMAICTAPHQQRRHAKVLAAEHCRYGTRDLALVEVADDDNGVYGDLNQPLPIFVRWMSISPVTLLKKSQQFS